MRAPDCTTTCLLQWNQGRLTPQGYPGGSVFGYSLCYNPSTGKQDVIPPTATCPAASPDPNNNHWQLGIAGINYAAGARTSAHAGAASSSPCLLSAGWTAEYWVCGMARAAKCLPAALPTPCRCRGL